MERLSRRGLTAAISVAVVMALASPGFAQGATVGATYPDADFSCTSPGGGGLWIDATYVVPAAGTVDSFAFHTAAANDGQHLAFKVVRPTGVANEFTVVGTTNVVALPGVATLATFAPAAPIPVQAGDVLGFWQQEPFLSACAVFAPPGPIHATLTPNPAAGATVTVPIQSFNHHLNVSAEFTPTPVGTCSNTPATISGSGAIAGTAGDDVIVGSSGNDTITGGGGNDLICAGDGNDKVFAGEGDDRIFGGEGDDNANGEAGNDKVFGEGGNDKVFGAGGDDTVFGNAGDDYANGGAGNDVINGGAGNDNLEGSNGDDTVQGSNGNDSLDGGVGFDTAEGGVGTDTFAFFELFIGPGANGVPG